MYHIGIDLGGTNIAAGVVDDDFNITGKSNIKTNTPRPSEEIVDDMAKIVKIAAEKANISLDEVDVVGVGSPGSVNPVTGVIGAANNLGFYNLPLREMLQKRVGIPVVIENDANTAAYGEMIAGAGKGTRNFLAITLGTGVGGGVIINGKIFSGFNYAGAELGHTVIEMGGEKCTCGRNGCFEAYASATALIRQTKRKMLEHKESAMWELVGGDISNVSGRTAFDAMRAGDLYGKEVVDKYIEYISCGVINMINIFQPEILCIGGGISHEGETLIAPIRDYIAKESFTRGMTQQTVIKAAELGNDAGIIGAAMLGKLN